MNVIAVIIDLEEVRKILLHLVKIGRGGGAPLRRPADPHRGWAPPAGSRFKSRGHAV